MRRRTTLLFNRLPQRLSVVGQGLSSTETKTPHVVFDGMVQRLRNAIRWKRTDELQSIFAELCRDTSRQADPLLYREAINSASIVGDHQGCCDLFLAFARNCSGSRGFRLPEAVVDSAYHLKAKDHFGTKEDGLRRVVDAAASHVLTTPDVVTQLAIARAFWRCVCLWLSGMWGTSGTWISEDPKILSVLRRTESYPGEKATLATARFIWDEVISLYMKTGDQSVPRFTVEEVFFRICRMASYAWKTDQGELDFMLFARRHCTTIRNPSMPLTASLMRACRSSGDWRMATKLYMELTDEMLAVDGAVKQLASAEYDGINVPYVQLLAESKRHAEVVNLYRSYLIELATDPLLADQSSIEKKTFNTLLAAIGECKDEGAAAAALQYYRSRLKGRRCSTGEYTSFILVMCLAKCGRPGFDAQYHKMVEDGVVSPTAEEVEYALLVWAHNAVDPHPVTVRVMRNIDASTEPTTERVFNILLQILLRIDSPAFLLWLKKARAAGHMKTSWAHLLVTWAGRMRYNLRPEDLQYVCETAREYIPVAAALDCTSTDEPADSQRRIAMAHPLGPQLAMLFYDRQQAEKADDSGPAAAGPVVDPGTHFVRRHRKILDTHTSCVPQNGEPLEGATEASLDRWTLAAQH